MLENLAREDLGAFIIRESTTHQACFALSVKVPKFNNPTGIAHYIIHRTPSQGFQLKVNFLSVSSIHSFYNRSPGKLAEL